MLTRTEGIVLKTQKYGEADLIVTYLTSDRGIINAFAKAPEKPRAGSEAVSNPLLMPKYHSGERNNRCLKLRKLILSALSIKLERTIMISSIYRS